MKYVLYILVLLLAACSTPKKEQPSTASSVSPEPTKADDAVVIEDQTGSDALKGSLRAKAEGSIGPAKLLVRYHSPAVRGRIVWGGLVPFDRVWVTGAHMATSFEVDRPFAVAGKVIPAGKYAFFTIPGKRDWTLIINHNWEQHLTDNYDEKRDVLRLTVAPSVVEVNQERLQYKIEQLGQLSGKLVVRWEKLELSLPIEVLP